MKKYKSGKGRNPSKQGPKSVPSLVSRLLATTTYYLYDIEIRIPCYDRLLHEKPVYRAHQIEPAENARAYRRRTGETVETEQPIYIHRPRPNFERNALPDYIKAFREAAMRSMMSAIDSTNLIELVPQIGQRAGRIGFGSRRLQPTQPPSELVAEMDFAQIERRILMHSMEYDQAIAGLDSTGVSLLRTREGGGEYVLDLESTHFNTRDNQFFPSDLITRAFNQAVAHIHDSIVVEFKPTNSPRKDPRNHRRLAEAYGLSPNCYWFYEQCPNDELHEKIAVVAARDFGYSVHDLFIAIGTREALESFADFVCQRRRIVEGWEPSRPRKIRRSVSGIFVVEEPDEFGRIIKKPLQSIAKKETGNE